MSNFFVTLSHASLLVFVYPSDPCFQVLLVSRVLWTLCSRLQGDESRSEKDDDCHSNPQEQQSRNLSKRQKRKECLFPFLLEQQFARNSKLHGQERREGGSLMKE